MGAQQPKISQAFEVFRSETGERSAAWAPLVQSLAGACALNEKTRALAYLAVLAAAGLDSGIPFHAMTAKQAGASRDEVLSAVLVGLPAVGVRVTQALPSAVAAYDAD